MQFRRAILLALLAVGSGCAAHPLHSSGREIFLAQPAADSIRPNANVDPMVDKRPDHLPPPPVSVQPEEPTTDQTGTAETGHAASAVEPVGLLNVVDSVHRSYPLLEAAVLEATVADGKRLAAWGAFDTKFKAATENGPVGFYETYRQSAGFNRPLFHGGEVFAGYRLGRGTFQPWYLERQTNDGGEFKAGLRVPLLRNRAIDARRAALWRANYDRQRANPEIRARLIWFVRDATVAYWNWVAAGKYREIGSNALQLSLRRQAQLKRRVEEGDLDPPELQDNLRSIAARESKLIDRDRKLEQAAVKLSLFMRDEMGAPLVLSAQELSEFPNPTRVADEQLEADLSLALTQRPELAALDAMARRVRVDIAEAENDFLPNVDAVVFGGQDMGAATSKKRDKSPLEVEAGIYVDVPLQRRKARGKTQAARAKLSQLLVKRQFVEDKISTEIQTAFVGLTASFQRLGKAREAKRLAQYMADVERRKFEVGQSNLLSVFLRETYAIEAAEGEVDALLEFFIATADYAAAMAQDRP